MTQAEQITLLKHVSGEEDESILLTYLNIAGEGIIHRVYPFRDDITEVPDRYKARQAEIAGYLLNKRGAEGENYHSENGINRSYTSANIPENYYQGVTPYVGVF